MSYLPQAVAEREDCIQTLKNRQTRMIREACSSKQEEILQLQEKIEEKAVAANLALANAKSEATITVLAERRVTSQIRQTHKAAMKKASLELCEANSQLLVLEREKQAAEWQHANQAKKDRECHDAAKVLMQLHFRDYRRSTNQMEADAKKDAQVRARMEQRIKALEKKNTVAEKDSSMSKHREAELASKLAAAESEVKEKCMIISLMERESIRKNQETSRLRGQVSELEEECNNASVEILELQDTLLVSENCDIESVCYPLMRITHLCSHILTTLNNTENKTKSDEEDGTPRRRSGMGHS